MNITKTAVHACMLKYQDAYGVAPTMREIAEEFGALNHRSSVRAVLVTLEEDGLIEAVKPEGHQRRYEAKVYTEDS